MGLINNLGLNRFNRREKSDLNREDNPDTTVDIPLADVNQNIVDNSIDKSKITFDLAYDAIISLDGTGDYISLEQALDDGKKDIYIKAGTYPMTRDITISNDDVSITGESKYLTEISGNFQIYITGDGFNLNNIYKSGSPEDGYMFRTINANYMVMNNNRFIYIAENSAFMLMSGGEHATISNNIIHFDNTLVSNYFYLLCLYASFLSFVDNDIKSENNLFLIFRYNDNDFVTGNRFESTVANSLTMIYFLKTDISIVKNNFFIAPSIATNATAITFYKVTNATATQNDLNYCSISVANIVASNVIVSNNKIFNSPSNGISVDTIGSTISENYIEGSGISGIYVSNASNKIINNTIIDSTENGIKVTDGTNNLVTGNKSTGNTLDGINFKTPALTNIMCNNNVCTGNSNYGINWEVDPISSTCQGNILNGNTTGQLNGSAGSNSQFANNVTA